MKGGLKLSPQVALAPVKVFPEILLDDETSQHKDGVREVVKVMKKVGEVLGLRRKVEKDVINCDKFMIGTVLTEGIIDVSKHSEF